MTENEIDHRTGTVDGRVTKTPPRVQGSASPAMSTTSRARHRKPGMTEVITNVGVWPHDGLASLSYGCPPECQAFHVDRLLDEGYEVFYDSAELAKLIELLQGVASKLEAGESG